MIVSSFRAAATTAWLDSILRLPSKPCREAHREKLQNDHPALSRGWQRYWGRQGRREEGQSRFMTGRHMEITNFQVHRAEAG